MSTRGDRRTFRNEDLVLKVTTNIDPKVWDESRYEAFLDELCGMREYQKEAIRASETIVDSSMCVENYHAILETVKSSIRDSLHGKGTRVAVLNDEAHHVANASGTEAKKWKEFLLNPEYGFRMVVGVSGTCYVDTN